MGFTGYPIQSFLTMYIVSSEFQFQNCNGLSVATGFAIRFFTDLAAPSTSKGPSPGDNAKANADVLRRCRQPRLACALALKQLLAVTTSRRALRVDSGRGVVHEPSVVNQLATRTLRLRESVFVISR